MRVGIAFGLALTVGFAAHQAGAQESLLEARRTAARSASSDAGVALQYGVALRRAGHDAEAAQELRHGAALPGGSQGDTGIMLRFELARTAIDRRDFQGAMAACRGVDSVTGGTAASHACMAEANLLWRLASQALPETALALANGTKSYEAKVVEGLSYELQVKDAEAEASFRAAAQWKPEASDAHVCLGRLLVRTGRNDEGVAELRRAVEVDPMGPEPNYELARALPTGAEAATLLEKAVRERPSYAFALQRLAEVDLELGRMAPARLAADAVVKVSPSEPSGYIVSGRVALAEGKPDEALRLGQRALGLLSNSARAKLLVADAYAAKGEIDLAVEAYQAAYGLDPGDPSALVHASVACHAQGRDTSARAFGERATHDFPQWGPGFAALGDALAAQGETARARTAYDTALKSTGPVDAAAVRAKLAALR